MTFFILLERINAQAFKIYSLKMSEFKKALLILSNNSSDLIKELHFMEKQSFKKGLLCKSSFEAL